jgi:hypothetical protein
MAISLPLLPRPLRATRVLGLVLPLLLPAAARADFATDIQEPLRLAEAKKFKQALVMLEKIAPLYQDRFVLHYSIGLSNMGLIKEKGEAAENIQLLRNARASLLKARPLAPNEQLKKEVREGLQIVDDALRSVGASPEAPPLAVAPAASSKDAEIAELKRRLAELEAKPAPVQAPKASVAPQIQPKAAPVPAAPTNRVVPSKFPATPKRPGYVTGRVLNSAGQPLVGADISITGISGSGENAKFATESGAGGLFSLQVPNGIYRVVAEWKTRYNDHNYKFDLHPVDGKDIDTLRSAPGIVKDFRWKITGLRPGQEAGKPNTFGESTKYYGGHISVDAYKHLPQQGEFVFFPRGSTVVLTLTPRAKLIDGSAGTTLTYRRTFESDITNIQYLSWYIDDIPIGLYTASAQYVSTGGTSQALRVRNTRDSQTYTSSAPVDFEPNQFDMMRTQSISVEAPAAP